MSGSEDSKPKRKLREGNCLQRVFYTFMFKVYRIGLKRPYTKEDFFDIDDDLKYAANLAKFKEYYRKRRGKTPLMFIMFFWVFPTYFFQAITSLYGDLVNLTMPFVLRSIINWFERYSKDPESQSKSLVFVFCD